jgi:hypothetical protein
LADTRLSRCTCPTSAARVSAWSGPCAPQWRPPSSAHTTGGRGSRSLGPEQFIDGFALNDSSLGPSGFNRVLTAEDRGPARAYPWPVKEPVQKVLGVAIVVVVTVGAYVLARMVTRAVLG